MSELKYKIGDQVKIKSLDWYNKNKGKHGIIICGMMPFCDYMSCYCGKIVTISEILEFGYCIKEDCGENGWTDEMFECLVEEKVSLKLTGKAIKNNEMVISVGEYILPEGYIFKDGNGNVINTNKIVLEKKNQYPKTYKECCKILNYQPDEYDEDETLIYGYMADELRIFQKLLVCRNAYWKLAGEEMRLGKPWEPSKGEMVYSIYRHSNEIGTEMFLGKSVTFEFPTPEMRDNFKEYFNTDIENCKELL